MRNTKKREAFIEMKGARERERERMRERGLGMAILRPSPGFGAKAPRLALASVMTKWALNRP